MSNLHPPHLLRVKTVPGVQFVMPASVPQSIEVRIARPVTINLVDAVGLFTVEWMELETRMTRQGESLAEAGSVYSPCRSPATGCFISRRHNRGGFRSGLEKSGREAWCVKPSLKQRLPTPFYSPHDTFFFSRSTTLDNVSALVDMW